MTKGSEKSLAKKVYGVTVIPLLILVVAFIAFVVGRNAIEKSKLEDQLKLDLLSALVEEQQPLSQEVYLNQSRGIKLRLERIIRELNEKYDNPVVCIQFLPADPYKHLGTFEECSGGATLGAKVLARAVKVGNESFGTFNYVASYEPGFAHYFPPHLYLAVIFSLVLAGIVSWILARMLLSRIVYPEREQAKIREAAIARTAQMFAHDVRKPFSLIKKGMQTLKSRESCNDIRRYIEVLDHDVQKSLEHVEDMMADVIAIGEQQTLNSQDVSFKKMVKNALVGVFGHGTDKKFSLAYKFEHRSTVLVDQKKIERVLMNLITNASEAISSPGVIRISTEENEGRVTMSVWNSDSFVPVEERNQIYEAFYSQGKVGGTGLGLAICKKLIESHGGTLRCESEKNFGTLFSFDVKKGTGEDSLEVVLPAESEDFAYHSDIRSVMGATAIGSNVRPINKICLVDDDRIAVLDWKAKLKGVEVLNYVSASNFLSDLQDDNSVFEDVDCFIIDFYFRGETLDGSVLISEIKKRHDVPVFLSTSNEEVDESLANIVIGKEAVTRQTLESVIADRKKLHSHASNVRSISVASREIGQDS